MRVAALSYRSLALWLLGFPEAAGRDAEQALKEAREDRPSGHVEEYALLTSLTHICCGNYVQQAPS